jgi:hypothetical protein
MVLGVFGCRHFIVYLCIPGKELLLVRYDVVDCSALKFVLLVLIDYELPVTCFGLRVCLCYVIARGNCTVCS